MRNHLPRPLNSAAIAPLNAVTDSAGTRETVIMPIATLRTFRKSIPVFEMRIFQRRVGGSAGSGSQSITSGQSVWNHCPAGRSTRS